MPGSNYHIRYDERVSKHDIPALSKSARLLIKKAIEQRLSKNPMHYGKPLRGSYKGARRLRVSNYRVIYAINHEEKVVLIVAIGHRKDIYEKQ